MGHSTKNTDLLFKQVNIMKSRKGRETVLEEKKLKGYKSTYNT